MEYLEQKNYDTNINSLGDLDQKYKHYLLCLSPILGHTGYFTMINKIIVSILIHTSYVHLSLFP